MIAPRFRVEGPVFTLRAVSMPTLKESASHHDGNKTEQHKINEKNMNLDAHCLRHSKLTKIVFYMSFSWFFSTSWAHDWHQLIIDGKLNQISSKQWFWTCFSNDYQSPNDFPKFRKISKNLKKYRILGVETSHFPSIPKYPSIKSEPILLVPSSKPNINLLYHAVKPDFQLIII